MSRWSRSTIKQLPDIETPSVYECQECGQLWAGNLNTFTGRQIGELSGFYAHSRPTDTGVATCNAKPYWIGQPADLMAAYALGGHDAVRATALDRLGAR